LTLATQYGFSIEGFDASTASLQSLKLHDVIQHCKALGLQEPSTREVCLKPPGNVWRHLRACDFFKGAQV
jgi:hypothetical protein